ncbi:MAG: DUF1939 domain-containing protein [Candidatus Heimdallarchaeota archaeon]|nr:MAG: DUF1939 domain-containing protein [Candidatus Heimdallarchaeota archaeon]
MNKNHSAMLKFSVILFVILIQVFALGTQSYNFTPEDRNASSAIISFSTCNADSYQLTEPIGEGVFLQAFYWQVPDNGKWWSMIQEFIPEFASVGFDALWTPPMSKTPYGDVSSCGYEPYDYYDLGEFDQMGRIRTRYGTRTELENMINEANNYGIAIVADIVINHNVGGELEYNTFTNSQTETNFMNIASGKFPRNYSHFYPCAYGDMDAYSFADFPDVCHKHPYVRSELIKWGEWLRDEIGFDGWRFDVALGIDADMLRDWMTNVTGWGVAEYWGGSPDDLDEYLDNASNMITAFDFFLMYELQSMATGEGRYNMYNLVSSGLLGKRKDQAVTFVVNHDTVRNPFFDIEPENRLLPYAYILTHEGYPCVFWEDYFDLNLQPHIKTLANIRNNYTKGDLSVLYIDHDLYIAQRNGDPGIIVGLNDNPTQWKEGVVSTKWVNTTLHDLTGQAPDVEVDENGIATIMIPPMGYAVFSDSKTITTVPAIPDIENPIIPTTIDYGVISIDGKLDETWGAPIYVDPLWDASGNQRDLTNFYLKHDNTNLYVGFGYGHKLWTEDAVHYGIAIDVRDGGSRQDPWVHPNISWSFFSSLPEYIYYLETETTNESWREIQDATKYSYDPSGGWDSGSSLNPSEFDSNSILGFTEMKIPLSEIDLSEGGELSVMVFSTVNGKLGAADYVPNDPTTDGSGESESWLTMPDPLNFLIEKTTTQETTSEPTTEPTTTPETSTIASSETTTISTVVSSTTLPSPTTNEGSIFMIGVIFAMLILALNSSRRRKPKK